MNTISQILEEIGPSRSSRIAEILMKRLGLSSDAARQSLARAKSVILKFPIPLLPNREKFLYLKDQRNTEEFWQNFLNDLRESNSIYFLTIDSLIAKGGIISLDDFNVICGAPIAMQKQVSSEKVLHKLIAAGIVRKEEFQNHTCIIIDRHEICVPEQSWFRARKLTEDVVLDGLREWARKLGFASYNSISIRDDRNGERMVGPFKWHLTGPSYVLPVKGKNNKPGFLVADVFSDATLNENQIKYFIRKCELLTSSLKSIKIFPLLVSEAFTGPALTEGKKAGVVMATPENLFGSSIAKSLQVLLSTLKNAAAISAANPDRLAKLLEQLKDIEGAAGNLRGILFELISGHLAKIQGGSIDIGVIAKDPNTGKTADIDVLRIPHQGSCVVIECKGKNPGGKVNLEEVENWIHRIPIFLSHLKNERRFAEATISFELWTSGTFDADAIERLTKEQKARVKNLISWKTGQDVFDISKAAKEKTINNALRDHFLKHPLAK